MPLAAVMLPDPMASLVPLRATALTIVRAEIVLPRVVVLYLQEHKVEAIIRLAVAALEAIIHQAVVAPEASAAQAAASSSAVPPISPISTMESVSGSSFSIFTASR